MRCMAMHCPDIAYITEGKGGVKRGQSIAFGYILYNRRQCKTWFCFALPNIAYPLKGSVRIRGNRLPSVIYYITEGNAKLRGNRLPPTNIAYITEGHGDVMAMQNLGHLLGKTKLVSFLLLLVFFFVLVSFLCKYPFLGY